MISNSKNTVKLTSEAPEPGARQRRRYLPAEQRKKELLDAALMEFSAHGYGAATIERIARRAGLSKAGVYAHYKSKDEMFEDLLIRLLTPSFPVRTWLLDGGKSLREAIETFIGQIYEPLDDPKVLAMLRLMRTESGRAPQLLRRWREEVVLPYLDEQQRVIDECVAKGLMRASALTRYFHLGLAPLFMAAQWRLTFDEAEVREEIDKIRQMHQEVLMELLVTEP